MSVELSHECGSNNLRKSILIILTNGLTHMVHNHGSLIQARGLTGPYGLFLKFWSLLAHLTPFLLFSCILVYFGYI